MFPTCCSVVPLHHKMGRQTMISCPQLDDQCCLSQNMFNTSICLFNFIHIQHFTNMCPISFSFIFSISSFIFIHFHSFSQAFYRCFIMFLRLAIHVAQATWQINGAALWSCCPRCWQAPTEKPLVLTWWISWIFLMGIFGTSGNHDKDMYDIYIYIYNYIYIYIYITIHIYIYIYTIHL